MKGKVGLEVIISEVAAKRFPYLRRISAPKYRKGTGSEIDVFHSTPSARHIILKFREVKHKDKILKCAREKCQISFKGTPISDLIRNSTGKGRMETYSPSHKRKKLIIPEY